jgi:hypothetical protein
MTGEDIADGKDLVLAVMNYRLCKLVIALKLLVVTICKWSLNPVTSPNPVYRHSIIS